MILLLFHLPLWGFALLALLGIAIYDLTQKRHTILNNFPIFGHLRYIFETIGPELRQYIVANNREELPFNRRQRAWIYASSKIENNFQGFGTAEYATSTCATVDQCLYDVSDSY